MNKLLSVGILLLGCAAIGLVGLKRVEQLAKFKRYELLDEQAMVKWRDKTMSQAIENDRKQKEKDYVRLSLSECADLALKNAQNHSNSPNNSFNPDDYDFYYKKCLHEAGIK